MGRSWVIRLAVADHGRLFLNNLRFRLHLTFPRRFHVRRFKRVYGIIGSRNVFLSIQISKELIDMRYNVYLTYIPLVL